MELCHISLFLIISLIALWLIKRRKKMSILQNYGIPGPKPNLITGNMSEIIKTGIHICLRDWEKQYGKIFGYYFGAQATIVVCDADLCKQIQIKDFSNFINRPVLIPGRSESKFGKHMIASQDNKWKEQRALLTPAFTTGKMKQMLVLVCQSIDVLISKIDSAARSGKEINIHDYLKALTLDIIAKTAFGVETDVQNNPNDIFYRGALDVIREDSLNGLVFLSLCFPELGSILYKLSELMGYVKFFFGTNLVQGFYDTCSKVVMTRRSNPELRREDVLQILVDGEMSDLDIKKVMDAELSVNSESEFKGQPEAIKESGKSRTGRKTVRLTDDEVMSNTFMFLFAGYETTSTALAYISHFLVNKPEIQEKIREEIQRIIKEEGELTYNSLAQLKYLDQVWLEALRFYPPVASFTNRVAQNEIKYDEVTIPKGVTVQIAVGCLHKNPAYWEEPEKFDPERFAPERRSEIHSMAFQPFGSGPRHCIGLRFANMVAKMALARLLNEYRLVPCGKTETDKIAVTMKFVIMAPKNGVVLKVEKIA